ncbi:hypothetical protein M378DRAFT_200609 [Amanita muscaria Koide BX008]|uniref:Bromo domain-containing protein n=1 Tax=Amanita muscaria (strain Koide BX008) TaxID=946122 RepID=A0A0C2S5Z5_AMAMK|nr:hypothetical protein M378DRAFT_200609 [Amanita muscaria Koide BX008]
MQDPNGFSSSYSHSGSPPISQSRTPVSSSSGLTLVLPSLKTLKSSKNVKKAGKHRSGSVFASGFQDAELVEKKQPRPLKLKPLKEVLTKLIAQIKKKDDYAFFLRAVNPEQVPGYSDVIKHPMDLGTMTVKVDKGKYRSLEDFTSDLKLVTTNAKTFNPAGTIYHTEADRIEAWALDHIAKAAPTVIQYETDWNIDVERDDEGHTVDIDNDDDSMDVESVPGGRSPSVVSQAVPGPSRRGPRPGYKKTTGTGIAESIEPDGRLPGAKDGLGAFPPGSDWARTMLQLKLKGKRYRTKKERLRIEKEGPPVLPEGSLDYTEMEDPFSVLSVFVPDQPTRPYLTPLYPPSPAVPSSQLQLSGSSTPTPTSTYPTATAAPLTYTFSLSQPTTTSATNVKRKHWTITRNLVGRAKGKEKEDDVEGGDVATWQTPREAHTTDFGTFALLAGELAQELRRWSLAPGSGTGTEEQQQDATLDIIRNSVDNETGAKTVAGGLVVESTVNADASSGALCSPKGYWTLKRAEEAEAYLRDVVYGGVDGYAYVRSLEEFVTTYQSEDSAVNYRTPTVFGVPLSTWVDREIIQPLTDGRHALLQRTAEQMRLISASKTPSRSILAKANTSSRSVEDQIYMSLYVYPAAMVALSALSQISMHKIDMAALITSQSELLESEEEWAGRGFKEIHKQLDGLQRENIHAKMEVEEPPIAGTDEPDVLTQSSAGVVETAEELKEVLNYVADAIVNQDQKLRRQKLPAEGSDSGVKAEEEECEEDPVLRNIRLNLLALAKRAPLDTIARLPKDLVPEHIRRFVPTLGET